MTTTLLWLVCSFLISFVEGSAASVPNAIYLFVAVAGRMKFGPAANSLALVVTGLFGVVSCFAGIFLNNLLLKSAVLVVAVLVTTAFVGGMMILFEQWRSIVAIATTIPFAVVVIRCVFLIVYSHRTIVQRTVPW